MGGVRRITAGAAACPALIRQTPSSHGSVKLVTALAERSDVKSSRKERTYHLDRIEQNPVTDAAADADPAAAEWGVKDIKADQVWSEYDDRGEGIVIAHVDSGVQYDHPALVGKRGPPTGGPRSADRRERPRLGRAAVLGGAAVGTA
ncbi:hypothetical protein [Streptomyces sp. NBC_00842]|uniref:hypothetical protein n=1 Tax=Streptomyces sp. NBC_00842 TaxID=2975848 RepID=UPI00386FE2D8